MKSRSNYGNFLFVLLVWCSSVISVSGWHQNEKTHKGFDYFEGPSRPLERAEAQIGENIGGIYLKISKRVSL